MLPPCFLVKISQILQKLIVFLPERRGDRDFILTYLDCSMVVVVNNSMKVFPHYCLFLSILAICIRKRWVKVGPNVQTLGSSFFHKYSNPSKNFQTVVLFARVLSAILDHIGGVRAEKPPKNGYFMDAESVRKLWKFLT